MSLSKNTVYNWMGSIVVAVTIPFVVIQLIRKICCKNNYNSLREKVVVITGASSGIGEHLAHAFYNYGCKVVLCARRQEELERVRNDLLQTHSTGPVYPPIVVPVDLSDLNSIPIVVQRIIDIAGHIDILINNGGITNRGSIADTNIDVFIKVMTVNYFGTIAFTKAVIPHMIKRKEGHVIFMSSIQGLIAIPYRAAYASSKHAIQAFSDSLRSETARANINVTIVSPGYVHTALSLNALTGSGSAHGQMDENTRKGYSPQFVAQKTVVAVIHKEKEIILAPLVHKMAIFLRANIPSLYFFIMARRSPQ